MNRYPPAHHTEHSRRKLAGLIEVLRLATLIGVHDGESNVSFIPMLVEHDGDDVRLLGHLDAANPQAAMLDGRRMQAVFHGPHAYISPDDYLSPQLPTWNYLHVVASGRVFELPSDEDKRGLLTRMSETLGGDAQEFSLAGNDARMAGLLGGIRAFCMDVDHMVGRFKLSQDKSSADALAALDAMTRKSAAREAAALQWLEKNADLP